MHLLEFIICVVAGIVVWFNSDTFTRLFSKSLNLKKMTTKPTTKTDFKGKRYALLTGANGFGDPGGRSTLRGCIPDLVAAKELLQSKGYTTVELLEDQFTGDNLRIALKSFVDIVTPEDQFVWWKSTHGCGQKEIAKNGVFNEEDGSTEYVVCWGYTQSTKNLVADDEIYDLLLPIPGKKLVVSDTCHSNSSNRLVDPFAMMGKSEEEIEQMTVLSRGVPESDVPAFPLREDRGTAKFENHKIVVTSLSGCQDNETSADAYFPEIKQYRGALSKNLIDTIKENPGLTVKDLHTETTKRLKNGNFKQNPGLEIPEGEENVLFFN